MVKAKKILAVDIGTQSLKASIVDESLSTIERIKIPYQPVTHSNNCVEIDIKVLWNAFIEACRKLKNKNIVGITFSTLCPSLLLMDSEGDALTPVILHLDRRSQKQSDWIVDNIGPEKFKSITGNPPIPGGISVTSMLWVKDDMGGKLPEGSVFGHVVTYFIKKLTGKFYIDPSNASFTGLYETMKYSDWSEALLEKTGISRKHLPEVLDSISVAGDLKPAASSEALLPAGIPVVIGANDTTCAVAGAGVDEPGMLLNTSGTVEIMVMCSDKPVAGDNHLIRTHAYRDRWLLMRTLGAGGASVEWFRRNFCKELEKDEFYKNYFSEVLNDDVSRDVEFHPYLTGDRHNLEKLTASFSNITLDSTRADFLYSLVFSNAKYITSILDEWKNICSMEKTIFHVGGGAGEEYTDIKRRILKDFRFLQIGETAERGAAILGFKALGIEPVNIKKSQSESLSKIY